MTQLTENTPGFSGPPTTAGLKVRSRSVMVLLIDDQAIIGEAVRRLLINEAGVLYYFCNEPERALEIAKVVGPTVILQDLVMPQIEGLELLRRFRADEKLCEIPVIVLSTKEDPGIKKQAFELGANDYLVKLPDQLELVARIRYHSAAYLNRLQRDAAMKELEDNRRQLLEANAELASLNSKLEEANKVISLMARQDALTGLWNRRVLDEEIIKLRDLSVRRGHPFTVIMLDLDRFKAINDNYGHAMGDVVLRKSAALLGEHMRSYDIAARYGGEEFALLLPETSLAEATEIAERLRAAVAAMAIEDYPGKVTASFGVATLHETEGVQSLLERADAALYQAKTGGRNRVEVSGGQMVPPGDQ